MAERQSSKPHDPSPDPLTFTLKRTHWESSEALRRSMTELKAWDGTMRARYCPLSLAALDSGLVRGTVDVDDAGRWIENNVDYWEVVLKAGQNLYELDNCDEAGKAVYEFDRQRAWPFDEDEVTIEGNGVAAELSEEDMEGRLEGAA